MKTIILIIICIIGITSLSQGQNQTIDDLEDLIVQIEKNYINYEPIKMIHTGNDIKKCYIKLLKEGEDSLLVTSIYIKGLFIVTLNSLNRLRDKQNIILSKQLTNLNIKELDVIFKNKHFKNSLPEYYLGEYYYYKGYDESLNPNGDINKVREYYYKAIAFLTDSNSIKTLSLLKGEIFNDLGIIEMEQGDYTSAVVHLQLASFNYKRDLSLLKSKKHKFVEIKHATNMLNHAEVLSRSSKIELALEYVNNAINIYKKYESDRFNENEVKNWYFLIFSKMYQIKFSILKTQLNTNEVTLKKFEELKKTLDLGLEMLDSIENTVLGRDILKMLRSNYNLHKSDLLFKQNRHDEAKLLFYRIKSQLNKKDKELAYLYFQVGEIYVNHLKSDSANYYLKETMKLIRKQKKSYSNDIINIQCRTLMAKVCSFSEKEETWKQGLELCDQAIIDIDNIRNKIRKDGFLGSNYFNFYNKIVDFPFQWSITLALKLYKKTNEEKYLQKFWMYKERSKMATFRKILTQNNSHNNTSNLIKNRLNYYLNEVEISPKAEKEVAFDIFYKEFSLLDSMNKENIKKVLNQQDTEVSSIEIVRYNNLQSNLEDSTLIIEFIEYQHNIYIIYLANNNNNNKPQIKIIPNNNNFKQWIEDILEVTSTSIGELTKVQKESQFQQYKIAASKLYKLLLTDILDRQEFNTINRLVFIPNGQLSHLNFEMLITKASNATKYNSTLPFLVKKYACTYDYSVSVWYELQNKQNYKTNGNILLIETNDTCKYSRESAVSEKGITFQYNYKITGNNAKDTFKSILNNHSTNILLIRTHGYKHSNPFKSHLLLNCLDTTIYEKFELWEFYGKIRLNYNLVILDACLSNYSDFNSNEGMISLTRGFRSAGSPSVISTLWEVSDYTSTKISLDFIDFLNQGLSKDKALQQAKLKLINEEISAPYYWAGNILVGNRNGIVH